MSVRQDCGEHGQDRRAEEPRQQKRRQPESDAARRNHRSGAGFLIPGGMTLGGLHQAIQAAIGWHGSHLHGFDIDGRQ